MALVQSPLCPHCAKPFSGAAFSPSAPTQYATPLVLPCGHTSCANCVMAAGLVCPECAMPVPTPRRWVPNRALIDAIQELNSMPWGGADEFGDEAETSLTTAAGPGAGAGGAGGAGGGLAAASTTPATRRPTTGAADRDKKVAFAEVAAERSISEDDDSGGSVTSGGGVGATGSSEEAPAPPPPPQDDGGQSDFGKLRTTLRSRAGRSVSRLEMVMGRVFVHKFAQDHSCPICFEPYSYGPSLHGGRVPCILPCSHTFCMGCLEGMHVMCCPECRKPFEAPLMPNVPLMELLRSAAASAAVDSSPRELEMSDEFLQMDVAGKPLSSGTDPVPFEVRTAEYQGTHVLVKTLLDPSAGDAMPACAPVLTAGARRASLGAAAAASAAAAAAAAVAAAAASSSGATTSSGRSEPSPQQQHGGEATATAAAATDPAAGAGAAAGMGAGSGAAAKVMDDAEMTAHFTRELACCQLLGSYRAHEFPFLGCAVPPNASRRRFFVHYLDRTWVWPEYSRLFASALSVASTALDAAQADSQVIAVCDMLVKLIGGAVSDNTSPRLMFISLGGLGALYNAVTDDERELSCATRAVACSAMLFLSREWEARKELGARGAAKALITLSEKHAGDCPKFVDSLLSVIWCLTMDESDAKHDVSAASGSFLRICESTMRLQSEEDAPPVLEKALGVLWGIAVNTDTWKVNDSKTRALYELGALGTIRSVLDRYPDHAGLCAEGCQLLWALSALSDKRKTLIAAGAIDVLRRCAERHCDKGKVVGTALHAIGLLIVRNTDEIERFIASGGRALALSAATFFENDPTSLVRIMALFAALVTVGDEGARRALLDRDCVMRFLDMMERYYEKDSLLTYLALSLKTPCLQLLDVRELLAQCSVVPRVLHLIPQLEREGQLSEVLQLVSVCSTKCTGEKQFLESDGLSVIMNLIKTTPSVGVKKGCFDILWNSVQNSEMRSKFVFSGGVQAGLEAIRGTKLQRMSSNAQENDLLTSICGCLSNICCEHAQIFGEDGVVLLSQLMQDSSVVRSPAIAIQCGNVLLCLLKNDDLRCFFDKRCSRNLTTAASNFLHMPDKGLEPLVRIFGCLAQATSNSKVCLHVDFSAAIVLAPRTCSIRNVKAIESFTEFLKNISAGPRYCEVLKDANVAEVVLGYLRVGRSSNRLITEAILCLKNLSTIPGSLAIMAKYHTDLRVLETQFSNDPDILKELSPLVEKLSMFRPKTPIGDVPERAGQRACTSSVCVIL